MAKKHNAMLSGGMVLGAPTSNWFCNLLIPFKRKLAIGLNAISQI